MQRNQSRKELEKLVEEYSNLTQQEIESLVDDLSNKFYALLVATECISFEIMYGKDAVLKINLEQTEAELH